MPKFKGSRTPHITVDHTTLKGGGLWGERERHTSITMREALRRDETRSGPGKTKAVTLGHLLAIPDQEMRAALTTKVSYYPRMTSKIRRERLVESIAHVLANLWAIRTETEDPAVVGKRSDYYVKAISNPPPSKGRL